MPATVHRSDFCADWVPSEGLLAHSLADPIPLFGSDYCAGFGRLRGRSLALGRLSDLAPLLRSEISPEAFGLGGADAGTWRPLFYAADAAEAVFYLRALLRSGDVGRVSEGIALLGGGAFDVARWGRAQLGPFLEQVSVFRLEVDSAGARPGPGSDPSDLSGIDMVRDATSGRDLIGEDIARWHRRQAA